MEQMKEQALKVGTEFHNDIVNKVSFEKNPFYAETDSGIKFAAKSIKVIDGIYESLKTGNVHKF